MLSTAGGSPQNFGLITDQEHIAVAPLHSDFQFQYLAWSPVHWIPTAGDTAIRVFVNLKRPSGTGQADFGSLGK
jgi:hypothetical protein